MCLDYEEAIHICIGLLMYSLYRSLQSPTLFQTDVSVKWLTFTAMVINKKDYKSNSTFSTVPCNLVMQLMHRELSTWEQNVTTIYNGTFLQCLKAILVVQAQIRIWNPFFKSDRQRVCSVQSEAGLMINSKGCLHTKCLLIIRTLQEQLLKFRTLLMLLFHQQTQLILHQHQSNSALLKFLYPF